MHPQATWRPLGPDPEVKIENPLDSLKYFIFLLNIFIRVSAAA